ncbi:Retinoic acid induced 16-like protein-domain-containing protein [Sporodiniella umbellata]|nr:Retinoic acid induced 16-like protein-domain-containing protein [Sporodiniella umbellata]
MVDLLVDEEARQGDATTGICMEYFLKHNVLQYLVNAAEKQDHPLGFRGEVIRTLASMVDLLDDRFLVHKAVHTPALRLLRFCVLDESQNELYTDDLVDLMYIICSKIHGFPALLNIFFHDTHWLTTPQRQRHEKKSTTDGLTYEFFLFTYLLRFVHREGRSGDYARTGLLFLMEMATEQLGEFILTSDFATILAAGLGALYSQLPRKLILQPEMRGEWPADETLAIGLEYAHSPALRGQLDSFLKLLEFSQDVLVQCPNSAIGHALLQTIRTIFVENILYPSILECSDADGSSVAVLSYMDWILQTVLQQDLANVIVGSLMDLSGHREEAGTGILRQLIFSRLQSRSEPALIATLKLLKTLIVHHCRYVLPLLSTLPEPQPEPTGVSHHRQELELYFSLMAALDPSSTQHALSQGYKDYLHDIEAYIDADPCHLSIHSRSLPFRRRPSFKYGQRHEPTPKTPAPRLSRRHRLHPHDPLLQALLHLLSHFFCHSPELNLALTGVLSALAFCPERSLVGWITFSKTDRAGPDPNPHLHRHSPVSTPIDDAEDEQSIDLVTEPGSDSVTRPIFFKSYPSLFTLFRTLVQQVDYYRADLPCFTAWLHDHRQALVSGETSLLEPIATHHVQKIVAVRIQTLFPSYHPPSGLPYPKETSLLSLFNNIILLEEVLKETIALIQVRCSLGVDRIAYV